MQHRLNENKRFCLKPKIHWKWIISWGIINKFSVSLTHLVHGGNSKPTQPWNHGPRFWIQHGNGIRYQTTIEMLEELQHSVLTHNSHGLTKKQKMDDSGCKEGDHSNSAIVLFKVGIRTSEEIQKSQLFSKRTAELLQFPRWSRNAFKHLSICIRIQLLIPHSAILNSESLNWTSVFFLQVNI